MPEVKKFRKTSDIPSMMNDSDIQPVTVVVPASFIIAAESSLNYSADITIGGIGTSLYASMECSLDGRTFISDQMSISGSAIYNGVDPSYNFTGIAFVYRLSPSVVRLLVTIANPYDKSIQSTQGSFTVTANIRTFKPPF